MAAAKKITLSPSRDIRAIEGQASGRDSGLAIAARQGHAEDLEAGIVIIPTGLRPAKRVQSVEVCSSR